MIYKDLAIAAGGGIIDHSVQAEQIGCASVMIGLGGTGIDCLRELKRRVYNRIKPDDGSDLPTYRHIQFLAIDSNRCSVIDESFAGIDPLTEFLDISCSDIHAILGKAHVLKKDPSLQWLNENIHVFDAIYGAGGIRQVGRLLLMLNVERIVSSIRDKITLAITNLKDTPVHIHIFTGMGGGTGAGIFLDICYIVQKILNDMSLQNAITCGYFFLPDVHFERVPSETARQVIEINGFAAMKELDYCMSFENNKGSWDQNYKWFEIHTSLPPVKLAHLISAKDETGSVIENGYNYAMNVVVDYVMDLMTSKIVSIPAVVKMLDKERGACYSYCIIGASNAYIPYKDINSYLAARIFEAYEALPRSCHDIETFVSNNGLAYKSLLNELSDAIPQLLTPMLHKRPEILGNIAKNKESLTQNTIMMLRGKLIGFCTDSSRGPIYSALLMRNYNTSDRDMISVIEGYTHENNKNESQARATMDLREKELAKALREFQSSNSVNRRNRYRKYVSAVHAYLTQDIKVQLYVEMGEFLKAFKQQVIALRDEFFSPLIETMDNVAETFKANLDALNVNVASDNDYAIKIVGLEDGSLKESLNEAVEQLDCKAIVLQFVQYMIDNPQKWESRNNDAQISAMVSEFFVEQLNAFTSKSIDSYLQTKYLAPTQAALINCIYQIEMVPLLTKASPLFWARSTINPKSRIGYCSVPYTSVAIQGAASKLQALDPRIMIINSGMIDRITILTLYRGVPMFMYKGVDLYYQEYQNCHWAGKHLYERSEYDERDFSELADIIPLSLIDPDNYTDKIKQFNSNYTEAVETGIVYKTTTGVAGNQYDYYLRSIDRADCDEKIRQIQTLLIKEKIEGIKRFLDDSKNTTLTFSSSIKLPNTGCRGYEDSAVKDHVFASLVLTKEMNNQLAVYREFEKTLNEAREFIAQ